MLEPATLRKMIVTLAAAAAVALAAQAAPAPGGHDQVLRQLIQDAARGQIRYETLTPALATAVRPQAAISQSQLTALGALKSVTFEKINPEGSEIYRADFDNGALDWAFSVNAEGLISNAAYRPATAPPK